MNHTITNYVYENQFPEGDTYLKFKMDKWTREGLAKVPLDANVIIKRSKNLDKGTHYMFFQVKEAEVKG